MRHLQLLVLAMGAGAIVAPAQEDVDLLADFGVAGGDAVGKSARFELIDAAFDEVLPRVAPVYDAATRIFTLTSVFQCKGTQSFTDLGATLATLNYTSAPLSPAPELISATLTPSDFVGPCPGRRVTGVFRVYLPRRAAFSFWIHLNGHTVPNGLGHVSFQGKACTGFDPAAPPRFATDTTGPGVLMLPLANQEAPVTPERTVTATITGNLQNMSFAGVDSVGVLDPPPPFYQPAASTQAVKVKAVGQTTGYLDALQSVSGGAKLRVGKLDVDLMPKRSGAKVAIFAIENAAGEGPALIPDFSAFADSLKKDLNEKYFGLQGNFYFSEVKWGGTVKVDKLFGTLNVSLLGLTEEQRELTKAVENKCVPEGWKCTEYLHIYYVRAFDDNQYWALAFHTLGRIYMRDITGDNAALNLTLNISVHELGHLLDLRDAGHLETDLMYTFRSVLPAPPGGGPPAYPCDIRRADWHKLFWLNPDPTKPSLPQYSSGVEELINTLGAGDEVDRSHVPGRLAALGTTEALDALVGLLDQSEWRVDKPGFSRAPEADVRAIDAVLHPPLRELAMRELSRIAESAPRFDEDEADSLRAAKWKEWWSANRLVWKRR